MEEKQKEKIKHQPKFWEFEILVQKIAIAQQGGCWNLKIKWEDHLANLEKVDGRNLFETTVTKWKWILTAIMKVSCSNHVKNIHDCKDKLGAIAKKFKIYMIIMSTQGTTKIVGLWILKIGSRSLFHETLHIPWKTWFYSFKVASPFMNHLAWLIWPLQWNY
jgi:hypothetical protein